MDTIIAEAINLEYHDLDNLSEGELLAKYTEQYGTPPADSLKGELVIDLLAVSWNENDITLWESYYPAHLR